MHEISHLHNPPPLVSVLLPIRNEAAYINRCLKAVLAQDYPPDQIEILIADGMSTDNSRQIVAAWQAQHPHIHLYDNPGKIVSTGLNLLMDQAQGETLIRVDGHCLIDPQYVKACVRHLQEEQVDGVGGPMHSIGEDLTSAVIALAMSSRFGVGDSAFRTETGETKLVDTVPFPAYTRDIVARVGKYDEELVRNQDDEYNYRIREFGGKILLAEDVRSEYFSRGTFAKLWKQYYQYGFWKVRVLQKHPLQMRIRQFVPLVFVLSLLLGLISAFLFRWGWMFLAFLVGVYLLANLLVSAWTAQQKGWKTFIRLPLAFAILHVSYGLGFLVGLFHFWNRWKS